LSLSAPTRPSGGRLGSAHLARVAHEAVQHLLPCGRWRAAAGVRRASVGGVKRGSGTARLATARCAASRPRGTVHLARDGSYAVARPARTCDAQHARQKRRARQVRELGFGTARLAWRRAAGRAPRHARVTHRSQLAGWCGSRQRRLEGAGTSSPGTASPAAAHSAPSASSPDVSDSSPSPSPSDGTVAASSSAAIGAAGAQKAPSRGSWPCSPAAAPPAAAGWGAAREVWRHVSSTLRAPPRASRRWAVQPPWRHLRQMPYHSAFWASKFLCS
jgi:hypothetical protein